MYYTYLFQNQRTLKFLIYAPVVQTCTSSSIHSNNTVLVKMHILFFLNPLLSLEFYLGEGWRKDIDIVVQNHILFRTKHYILH